MVSGQSVRYRLHSWVTLKGALGLAPSGLCNTASTLPCALFLSLVLQERKVFISVFAAASGAQDHQPHAAWCFRWSVFRKAWFRLQFPILTLTETCSLVRLSQSSFPRPPALSLLGQTFMEEFSFAKITDPSRNSQQYFDSLPTCHRDLVVHQPLVLGHSNPTSVSNK